MVPTMKIVPPIVGVPRLAPCEGLRMSSGVRMTCPQPHLRNSRRKTGVRKSVNASEIAAAVRRDLTRRIDRKRVVWGKSGSVRVDQGGRRERKKKTEKRE